MKGYWTNSNYMGWIPSKEMYMKFENDVEYYIYYIDNELEA